MRLLNVDSCELREFGDDGMRNLKYAIISHRWRDRELRYKDFQAAKDRMKLISGSRKIAGFCEIAKQHQFTYVWIDSLCINQDSSAELSEAINSMYNWYTGAKKCFVYLEDVQESSRHFSSNVLPPAHAGQIKSDWKLSEWWERGWTLQELIAPKEVTFFDMAWRKIADLYAVSDLVSQITKVPKAIFTKAAKPKDFSIAQRMSWAAERRTTRGEDRAYSLLGIFDVNIPANYGEGPLRAFTRLQEELIKQSTDQSIFAWDYLPNVNKSKKDHLLASSPEYFRDCGNLLVGQTIDASGLAWISSIGLQTTIRMLYRDDRRAWLILNCRIKGDPTRALAIPVVHDTEQRFCLPLLPSEHATRLAEVDTLQAVRDATKRAITICRSWKQYDAISQPYNPRLSYVWLLSANLNNTEFRIIQRSNPAIWDDNNGLIKLPDTLADFEYGITISNQIIHIHLCFAYTKLSNEACMYATLGGPDFYQLMDSVDKLSASRDNWSSLPLETKTAVGQGQNLVTKYSLAQGLHESFLTVDIRVVEDDE